MICSSVNRLFIGPISFSVDRTLNRAATDLRGQRRRTASGDRFLRPVCFQNFPDALLPDALKNSNPLGIDRLVNGEKTRDSVA
jgi:hypothetical protein